jgi:hypothetical protein
LAQDSWISEIVSRFGHALYLRFDDQELRGLNLTTSKEISFRPILATCLDGRGVERVAWIGEAPAGREPPDAVTCHEPFSHPRLAVADVECAVILLRHAIARVHARTRLIRPRVVLHPTRRWPGGLSDVERHALQSAARDASAHFVYIHEGAVLSRTEALELARARRSGRS